jgi:tripartite-type tricarboxylate transporter receptor subunit TctC
MVVVATVVALSGCTGKSDGSASGRAAGGEWKWERKVTLVCPWGVGGGADGTLRPLQPLLQEILGVPVEIVNVEGAGGANGVNYAYKQPADGYTYVLGTQSIIMLDIQKILPFDWRKEFTPVAKLVHSINILTASKKAMRGKFTDFPSFITYAKAHPQELSCGMLTATGSDAASLRQALAAGLGVSLGDVDKYVKTVAYGGGAEISSAQVGGHLTLAISGADEVAGLLASGDIVPLVAMVEAKMSSFPKVMTTGELGFDACIGTWRGLYTRHNTPQAAIDSMYAAIEKAWYMPAYQDFLRQASYLDRKGLESPADTLALQNGEYPLFTEYLKAVGILK